MLYVKPEYYEKFACVADRCEATCCAGWQIVIDEAAGERYKSEQGEYGVVLRERIDWEDYLNRCKQTLYGEGVGAYHELQKRFQEYCAQECFAGVSMDIILEQLAVYFVFAYFCGAVYDDNVIGKIRMAVDSITVLHEMFAVKWAEQDGCLSAKDIQKIVYRYSRELEHSDVNLEVMQNV